MLAEPGADPTALRKAVTSPNGTTERAIATFDERGHAGHHRRRRPRGGRPGSRDHQQLG